MKARLKQRPDGYASRDYPVTVGEIYDVLGVAGCCLIVTTNDPDETAIIHRDRFDLLHPD